MRAVDRNTFCIGNGGVCLGFVAARIAAWAITLTFRSPLRPREQLWLRVKLTVAPPPAGRWSLVDCRSAEPIEQVDGSRIALLSEEIRRFAAG